MINMPSQADIGRLITPMYFHPRCAKGGGGGGNRFDVMEPTH